MFQHKCKVGSTRDLSGKGSGSGVAMEFKYLSAF